MSVGQSVTLVRPAKTAEPIEMPFGLRTWVGPRNHVLDGVQIPSWEWTTLRGQWAKNKQTDTQTAVTTIHFASATPHAKYNQFNTG